MARKKFHAKSMGYEKSEKNFARRGVISWYRRGMEDAPPIKAELLPPLPKRRGRPPGVKNDPTAKLGKIVDAALKAHKGFARSPMTPVELAKRIGSPVLTLVAVSRREPEELAAETGMTIQEAYALVLSAAKIAAPYIDRAMPQEVVVDSKQIHAIPHFDLPPELHDHQGATVKIEKSDESDD